MAHPDSRLRQRRDRFRCFELVQMLSIALEIASGNEAPNLPIVATYDRDSRTVVFLPRPKPMEYGELRNFYKLKLLALQSA